MGELEKKAETTENLKDTWVFNVSDPRCICGGALKYDSTKRNYVCKNSDCNAEYSPQEVLG